MVGFIVPPSPPPQLIGGGGVEGVGGEGTFWGRLTFQYYQKKEVSKTLQEVSIKFPKFEHDQRVIYLHSFFLYFEYDNFFIIVCLRIFSGVISLRHNVRDMFWEIWSYEWFYK